MDRGMKPPERPEFTAGRARPNARRSGFTLIEVVLVLVLIIIISSISLPFFSNTLKGLQLKTSARTIRRAVSYARGMAIMREEVMTLALDPDTMEIFGGGFLAAQTNSTDGVIDQDVLKRLGYKDGDESSPSTGGIDKEIHYRLPEHLTVKNFDKDWTEADDEYPDLYLVRFFPNGQCEWFKLELEDNKGDGILLEIDPVSGKMNSEFTQ